MRRQLVVQQIRNVQVHQLGAAEVLQGGLNLGLHHLEFPPGTGDPDKTLRRQGRGQDIGFRNALAAGGDGEYAHTGFKLWLMGQIGVLSRQDGRISLFI